MDIGARRVFRLSLTLSASLAVAYGLQLDLPYFAPLFAFMLCAAPKPPMGLKGMIGLIAVLLLTLGIGLLLIPMLLEYPLTALMLVLVGLFFSNYLSLNLGKPQVGALLTVGLTMISAAGMSGFAVATTVIQAMIIGIVLALICHALIYPLFPEDAGDAVPPDQPMEHNRSGWLALRASLIVFPSYLLALTNPTVYMPLIMKSVALGQQASETDARDAGYVLLGSTLMAGVLAALFWVMLSIWPVLWMFTLWMLLFSIYITAKFYGVIASRFSASFWQNVMVTLIILFGPAVADSATGKDVYKAFAVRMALFVAVTLYAWLALVFLEWWRTRAVHKHVVITKRA